MICPYICEKSLNGYKFEFNEDGQQVATIEEHINVMMKCKKEKCAVWDSIENKCKYN